MSPDLHAVALTLQVALASTLLILVPGVAAGYLLAHYRGPGKGALETCLTLPLVLPPTAVGLLLLELFARRSPLGAALARAGVELLFTWKAVLMATAVMSFPLLVRSTRTAFEELDARLPALARTLGSSRFDAFLRVSLPLARRGILAGAVLAFARALGEFGATILVAGNIPGRTQTLALAIFQHSQLGHDTRALQLVLVTVVLAFVALWTAERLAPPRAPRG